MQHERHTVDQLFSNTVHRFQQKEAIYIDKCVAKIREYESKIHECNDEDKKEQYTYKIRKLEQKRKKYEEKINFYFLENSNDLFHYFEIKKNIENNNNPKTLIHRFFDKNRSNEQFNQSEYKQCIETYMRKNNFDIYNNEYLNPDENHHICTKCNQGEMIQSTGDGIMICNHCHVFMKYLIHNDKPTYKEPPKEISFYAYRRINHFKEILSQFQAKETTDIPIQIIENIQQQIKKERIDLQTLTNKKTKEILKKLGYNKYYEHITFIKDKLGIKPPIMSPQLEETLCNLFIDIQVPYAKFCPSDRVNFLNYYYTLYKLCELLGETKYLPHFPMLKEQKKIEQDEIWKKICDELKWDFIPTL
tara:strand:- start:343 stop:1425 length:1083 start_codon:yes stop_codon:yes gene_type:complete